MKKNCIILVTIVGLFFIAGCASMNRPSPGYDVSVNTEKGNDFVELTVTPIWKQGALSYAVAGLDGFGVSFANKTDSIVKVIWEECSLSYRGSAYTPFISGQKFADANTPATPMIIPRKATVSKTVHSANQVFYSGGEYGSGWILRRIDAKEIILTFCIQKDDKKEYYVATVKEKGI